MCQSVKGPLAPNTLDVVILPDGRIRIETGSFAGASHTSANAFLAALVKELGVSIERREPLAHTHAHEHAHEHEHQHAGTGSHGGHDHG
jgi:hypothetical protein